MGKDGVLNDVSEDAPDEGASIATINRFSTMYEKSRAHIVLNLGEEPTTLLTSLQMLGAKTEEVWNKIQDSYLNGNIRLTLTLRTQIHTSNMSVTVIFRNINYTRRTVRFIV